MKFNILREVGKGEEPTLSYIRISIDISLRQFSQDFLSQDIEQDCC